MWYAEDIKVYEVADGYSETVFSENFDSATSKFTHTTTNTNYNNLNLDSNQTGGAKSGVGSLYSWAYNSGKASGQVFVKDEAPLSGVSDLTPYLMTDVSSVTNASDSDPEYFKSESFSLTNADRVILKFKYYHPGNARKNVSSLTVNDILYLGLTNSNTASYPKYGSRITKSTIDSLIGKTTSTYGSDFASLQEWRNVSITFDPSAEADIVAVSDDKTASKELGITIEELRSMNQLNFFLRSRFGGRFYLDDISLIKVSNKEAGWLKDSYISYRAYECDIARENVPEIELKEVVFSDAEGMYSVPVVNGQVKSVTVKHNHSELPVGTRLVVAVYSGKTMTDCGISGEVLVEDFSGGTATYNFTDVLVDTDSVVKVFWLNMGNLIPELEEINPISQERETKIFLAGDSIVATYEEGHVRTGWGQVLDSYINTNFVEIVNCAISGTGANDFAKRYVGNSNIEGSTDSEKMLNKMGADEGDYIFMSFATNDGTVGDTTFAEPYGTKETEGSFKYCLYENFIKPAKARGVTPVLVTTNPKEKLSTYAVGNFYVMDDHIPYVQAMRELAAETDTAIIDLYAMAVDNLNIVGAEGCEGYYVDGTHITAEGANVSAGFVARGLNLTDLEISKFVK